MASNVGRANARVSPVRSVDENASARIRAFVTPTPPTPKSPLERAETQVLNSVPEGNVSHETTGEAAQGRWPARAQC
jgi:hypothetical protein